MMAAPHTSKAPKFGSKWLWTMLGEPGTIQKVVATAKETGCTDLVVLVNDPPARVPTWRVRFGPSAIAELSAAARDAGLNFHVSSWLTAKAPYVDAAAAGMAELADATKAKSVCFDLEGEWRHATKNHAGFVADTVAPAFKGFPVPIGITSFAILPPEVVPALAWAVEYHNGYGQPQAYSVYQGKSWQKSAILTPDRLPQEAWAKWSPITKRLVCLLGAWGDEIPGRRVISNGAWSGRPWGIAETIDAAASSAKAAGFPDVGFWSEEALSKTSNAAKTRRAAVARIRATGKSLVRKPWYKRPSTYAAGAGLVAAGALVKKVFL